MGAVAARGSMNLLSNLDSFEPTYARRLRWAGIHDHGKAERRKAPGLVFTALASTRGLGKLPLQIRPVAERARKALGGVRHDSCCTAEPVFLQRK